MKHKTASQTFSNIIQNNTVPDLPLTLNKWQHVQVEFKMISQFQNGEGMSNSSQ